MNFWKSTLETSGKDVITTLETSGKDVITTLEASVIQPGTQQSLPLSPGSPTRPSQHQKVKDIPYWSYPGGRSPR